MPQEAAPQSDIVAGNSVGVLESAVHQRETQGLVHRREAAIAVGDTFEAKYSPRYLLFRKANRTLSRSTCDLGDLIANSTTSRIQIFGGQDQVDSAQAGRIAELENVRSVCVQDATGRFVFGSSLDDGSFQRVMSEVLGDRKLAGIVIAQNGCDLPAPSSVRRSNCKEKTSL
ncbi:hypothetical protein [Falsiphaeobacter marinintestinus]|uniref:hypothetical protein n=1 Tax=Falsiphaeobacter marinintestinus TaxID=1492905 RepID=UPI0011B5A5B4|nr:hypothetical protein [Phaeobacter marinintestinus]